MDVKDITWKAIEGTGDFQEVVSIGFGGGYDWDDLEAWYSPSRRKFFWLEGSGCSCSSLGDGVESVDHFEAGNRESLIAAVRKKYEDGYDVSPSAMLADIAAVKTYRVAK